MKSNKKRIIVVLAILTMALVLSCSLVACDKTDTPDAPKKEFTITFDTQGGSEVKPITIAEGATITLPRNPTKEGYLFDGWYLSDAFVEKFVATKTITGDITLYAKWIEDNGQEEPPVAKTYSITFMVDGVTYKTFNISEGGVITLPENPEKKCCIFEGWYIDEDLLEKFNATQDISQDIVVYAKWSDNHTVVEDAEVPATCTTAGVTAGKHCSVCNEILKAQTEIPALGHDFSKEWTIDKEATCTEKGSKSRHCTRCEVKSDETEIPTKEHSESNWIIDKEATCTEDGSKHTECTVCHTTIKTEKISALGHTDVIDNAVEPTCTTSGLTQGKHCSTCGKILQAQTEIPALGHDFSKEWTIDKEATCTEKGSKSHHCTRCEVKSDETEIPTKEHSESNWIIDKEATCTEDGSKHTECTVCHTTIKTEKISALGHDLEHHAGQPATCTEKGWEEYVTCKRDGCTYTTYKEIDALGHDIEHHVGQPATCTEKGWEEYDTCKRDGCTYTTYKEIPALDHDLEHHVGQPATCTEKGWEAYVTCKRDGCTYTTYKEIAALGHVLEHHAGQPATCTEKGWEAYDTCKRDGCTYTTYKEIPALDHDLEHHAGQPATCTEKGWEEYVTCKRDGCTYTTYKEIPALDHDIVYHEAKSPTCTEVGWGKYESCSRCDYTTYKEIPALDHDLVYHEAKSPTCAEVGWDKYESCSRCDYSTYKEIPARHNFDENGTCVVCGYFETGLAFELNKDGESYSVVGIGTFDGTDLKIPNVNFDTKPVTGIKSNAFENCGSLISVIIPDSVTSIGEGAFKGCSSLASMVIPFVGAKAGVTSSDTRQYPFGYIFGASNYDGSVATEQEYYDESTTTTFMETYYIPLSLKSVTVTGGNILYGAFYGCRGLTSITIPDSETTTSIGDFAFFECSGLQNVIIPGNITSIGHAAFAYCTGLSNITVDENNPRFMSINNCIIDKESREIVLGCKTSVIPTDGSVISIGNAAFGGCTELINIIIPDNIINIGLAAFAECTGLKNITIPDGVHISDLAFAECTGLTSIIIPDSVAQFGSSVFEGCVSLTKITGRVDRVLAISNECGSKSFEIEITGNMNIEANAFAGRTELTGVTIGNEVERLGTGAFQGCININKITGLVDRVVAISKECGSGAFEIEITGNKDNSPYSFAGRTELIGVTIGNEVTSLEEGAFQGCTNINKIAGRADLVVAISKECGSGAFEIEITGNWDVEPSAFANRTEITGVTIGNSVTKIGNSAFSGCTMLNSVTIGNSVTTIGNSAFSGCIRLNSLIIGNSVTTIGSYAFSKCTGLISVTIGDSVTTINAFAFQDCPFLISVTIGNKVKSIGQLSFFGCFSLIEVYNKSSLNITAKSTSYGYVGYYAKNVYTNEGGSKLATDENGYVIYTDGEEKILVSYFGTETELTLPSDITQIHNYAFAGRCELTSIIVLDNVTSIGTAAFRGCSGLTSITIPDSVTSIGEGALTGCSSLESITIPFVGASITAGNGYDQVFGYIFGYKTSNSSSSVSGETYQYYDNSKYYHYYIPSSIKYVTITGGIIPYRAFYNCSGLTSITIPGSVTSIGNYAFSGCNGLTNITIPNSVKKIGESAFSGCKGLMGITFNGTIAQWKSISKGALWKNNVPSTCIVHCIDGDIKA